MWGPTSDPVRSIYSHGSCIDIDAAVDIRFIMLNKSQSLNSISTAHLPHLLFACGVDPVDRSSPPLVNLAKSDYILDNYCELYI